MNEPPLLKFLELPTKQLLEAFGAGRHKPGSGSAAALLGLLSCRMLQTVICVTKRNPRYNHNIGELGFISELLAEKDLPFFQEAVQKDSEQFDRYFKAAQSAKRLPTTHIDKARFNENARKELALATEIPLEIARRSAETAGRSLVVYDLGAIYARGDSGVAVAAALGALSGALSIVYLNLSQFREGQWAQTIRTEADRLIRRFEVLQTEHIQRVSSIRLEGIGQEVQNQVGLRQAEFNLNLPPIDQIPRDLDPANIGYDL